MLFIKFGCYCISLYLLIDLSSDFMCPIILVVRFQYCRVLSTPSLTILGPLLPAVVIPIRVPSMGQIDMFKNFVLDRNA